MYKKNSFMVLTIIFLCNFNLSFSSHVEVPSDVSQLQPVKKARVLSIKKLSETKYQVVDEIQQPKEFVDVAYLLAVAYHESNYGPLTDDQKKSKFGHLLPSSLVISVAKAV